MNQTEALEITHMVIRTWPNNRAWESDEMLAYAEGLMRYDAATCVNAVAAAQQELHMRPTVAELRQFYDLERAKVRAATERTQPIHVKKEVVPLWVRRWLAARYMYRSFGRDQDMRRFTEQGDRGNPYTDLMPADAWLDEAAHVTDTHVWNTLKG